MAEEKELAIRFAKKYLEDLLSFFGLNTEVYATAEEDVIELHVPSTQLNAFLIGHNGENLRALQFLVMSALKNSQHALSRVSVDIAEYKKQRSDRLIQAAQAWLEKVKNTGKPMELEPMSPADRRTVHKVAGEQGLTTESVGEGRERHIVLKPTSEKSAEK